jgi:uncharacterized integral membrane protein
MPWRLILFIVIFAIFLVFVTLNLDNRCNINFGFAKFEGVPIFLTVFISFSMGLICATPLALHLRKKKIGMPRKDKGQINEPYSAAPPPANSEIDEKIKQDAVSARERFFSKRRSGKK